MLKKLILKENITEKISGLIYEEECSSPFFLDTIILLIQTTKKVKITKI